MNKSTGRMQSLKQYLEILLVYEYTYYNKETKDQKYALVHYVTFL